MNTYPCRNENCVYNDIAYTLNCRSSAFDDCKEYKPLTRSESQLKFKKLYRKYRGMLKSCDFEHEDCKLIERIKVKCLGYRCNAGFDINVYLKTRIFRTTSQNLSLVKLQRMEKQKGIEIFEAIETAIGQL